MKLTTRTQEVEDSGKRKFEALDILVSHNGKAIIWRWNNAKDAALVHTIVEKMNKMVDALKKDNPELVDKEPKKSKKKPGVVKPVVNKPVEVAQVEGLKALKQPGATRID